MAEGALMLRAAIDRMGNGRISPSRIRVQTDRGAGRAVVILRCGSRDSDDSAGRAGWGALFVHDATNGSGAAHGRVIELLVAPPASGSEWEATSEEVERCLESLGVRHCPIVGVGGGSVVVEHLAVTRPKLCQVVVLVDPTVELGSSWCERMVARLERWLPLGLPLRIGTDHFSPAPFLHRIRSPVLVLATPRSSEAEARQMAILAQRIPNGWFQKLSSEEADSEAELVRSFLLVKHRHPMRRGASGLRDLRAE